MKGAIHNDRGIKKKGFWRWGFALLFVGIAAVLIKQATEETPEPSKPAFLSDLIIITAQTHARNWKVDENTEIFRMEATNSHTITIYYSLLNYDSDGSGFDLDATKSAVIKIFCDPKNFQEQSIFSLGGTYVYVFGSKNVKEISRFEFNKQSCEGSL